MPAPYFLEGEHPGRVTPALPLPVSESHAVLNSCGRNQRVRLGGEAGHPPASRVIRLQPRPCMNAAFVFVLPGDVAGWGVLAWEGGPDSGPADP